MHPLRSYRKARNLRLVDVAQKTGLSAATISKIERGDTYPSAPAFRKLRAFTGGLLSANDFFHSQLDDQVRA